MKLFGLILSVAWAAAAIAAEPPTELPEPPPEFTRKPLAQDYYPATARALGQQGTVKVRLCYDDTGKVIASTLEESSSFERLDQAAVLMGKAYRFKPGIINGQSQSGCVVVPVEFSLKEPQMPAGSG